MTNNSDLHEADSTLVDRYEELRSTALDSSVERSASRGLALLMNKGMAAWIHTWSRLIEPEARRDNTRRPRQSALEYSGVVMMLAEMTLSAAREVSR